MGSVLEKLTYYDILGYLVPGMIFWICTVWEKFFLLPTENLEFLGKLSGFCMLAFIVISYVTGMILSEIARRLSFFVQKYFANEMCSSILEEAIVKKALKNSGMTESEPTKIEKEHYRIMYSAIQADSKYSRIHNYASAEILYKNLVVAFLLSMIGRFFLGEQKEISFYYGICIASVIIFGLRWKRFSEKKRDYTVLWFTEKYIK